MKIQLYLGYTVIFAVTSILIFSIMFLGIRKMVVSRAGESHPDALKQISERSNSIRNSIITISDLYRYNQMVYDCLTEEAAGKGSQQYPDGLKDIYDRVSHDVGLSYDVVIIGDDGFRYSSNGEEPYDFEGLKNQLWFRKSYDAQGDIVFVNSFQEKFDRASQKERYVFSAFSRITDQDRRELGIILVNVDEKYLYELCELSGQNSNIYIFNSKGDIVSSKEKSLPSKNCIGVDNFRTLYGENQTHMIKGPGKECLLSNCHDSQTGWTIVERIPGVLTTKPTNRFLLILMAILLICLITGAGVFHYVVGRLAKSVLKLCSSMNQVRQGNFDTISGIGSYEEVTQLKDSFNGTAGKTCNLMESTQEKEIPKQKLEMDFLRAQINPRFLYNTLLSIQCMAELGKNDQTVHAIAVLIDLLKKTLSMDAELIPLKERSESTEKYPALQQIRYGEKIYFKCDMGRKAEACLMSALMIQLVAENTIFHELEARKDLGLIAVESSVSDDMLFITVSGDRISMDKEGLEQLRESFDGRKYQSDRFIGISNMNSRVKINFGDEYRLMVESEMGVGTTATTRFPAIERADREWKNESAGYG